MINFFGKIYDNRRSDSLAASLRRKRFALFKSLLVKTSGFVRILDVGGTQKFWELSGFLSELENIEITIMNIRPMEVSLPKLKSTVGNGTNMSQFKDGEFDIVFSNSVIEHVGNYDAQMQMASEVKRVGKRYFIQTPNLYFPIEPHFVFPFFQFLPLQLKLLLIRHFRLGWRGPIKDKIKAIQTVNEVRLLSKKEFINLFPNAKIFEEKFAGLTKSFIAYEGWDNPT
ncbi:MAG TPA: methyltransferase domain-containing protein [Leptolyngbyaceae cyanobacterium]